MANRRPVNPTNLPWFPFYAAAWLGSDTVMKMTMTEAGIYINLMATCWQYGSIPWDKTLLSKHLNVDQRTIGRFMEKYRHLTSTFHEGSTKVPSTLHEPSMKVTLPKVQEFAETLGKNGGAPAQRRGDEKKGEVDEADAEGGPASQPTLTSSPKGQAAENQPVPPVGTAQPPAVKEEATATAGTAKAVNAAGGPILNDIREWPDGEDRSGISGTRLRNCIIWCLDHKKGDYFRREGITVASMGHEAFVKGLDTDWGGPLG